MDHGAIPPAAIGLAAGLATSTVAIALSATGLLPGWATTPLLFLAGGLAAGIAAPVRPTTGALLGGVTGVFAAVLLTAVLLGQWTPVPDQYLMPPPFTLIAGASAIMLVPVNAAAGAVGTVARPRLLTSRGYRARGWTPEQRQWLGIATGSLCIFVGLWAGLLVEQNVPSALLLVSTFAGGFIAGILSPGGARAGFGSGLLVGVFGLGAVALYFIWQASITAAEGGSRFAAGLWPIAIAIMAFWVLPAVALGGTLGGSYRKPSTTPAKHEL